MALDYVYVARAKIQEYRKAIAAIEESLRAIGKLDDSALSPDGSLRRRPGAWNVADDIEILLENGPKPEETLIAELVEQDFVRGDTREAQIANARKAITRGINIGYLRRDADTIAWVPGVRVNTRIGKKYLHK